MGYNEKEHLITEPIGLHDVARALGENTLAIDKLCTSSLINPNSFYKPIKLNATDDTPRELLYEDICAHDAGYTNLPALVCESLSAAQSLYNNNQAKWVYEKPTGFFRITDFIGYHHTSGDFTPTGSVTYPDNNYEEGTITLSWGAENQKHVPNFKTYNDMSKNNEGFMNLGVLIMGLNNCSYYHIGHIKDFQGVTSASFSVGNQISSAAKLNLQLVPILVDRGGSPGANDREIFAKGQIVSNSDFINNSNRQNKFLVLGGTPLKLEYKNLLYRLFENIEVEVHWAEGGYYTNNGNKLGRYNGTVSIKNGNAYNIYASIRVVANGADGFITLYETSKSDAQAVVNNETRNFEYLQSGRNLIATIAETWNLPIDQAAATIRVQAAIMITSGSANRTAAFDYSWSVETVGENLIKESYNYLTGERENLL